MREMFGACVCRGCALSFRGPQVLQEPGGAAVKPRPALSLLRNPTAKSSRPDPKIPAAHSGKHQTGNSVEKSGLEV